MGRNLMNYIESAQKRLMDGVKIAESGCWEWTRNKSGKGYGAISFQGKKNYAHRVSLAVFSGFDIKSPFYVMHKCDNPICVNPDHLKPGTQFDNMRDAARKGRTKNMNDWRGAKNPKSKLNDAQLFYLVRDCLSGEYGKYVGPRYEVTGVRATQIMRALRQ